MQPVSSTHSATAVTSTRTTAIAGRATTEAIPDVTSVDPADLRSRLHGGEALQSDAEAAGVENDETNATSGQPAGAVPSAGLELPPAARIGAPPRGPAPTVAAGSTTMSSGRSDGRDATRNIEDLATTMAVDTATVRQSIDDGSLNQLLAQNGVQSSLGMLFNTKL